MALPEDLKTKLSLDEEVSSPREALSRASADKIAWRHKNLKSFMSRSYANHRDKNHHKLTGFDVRNRRYERNSESSAIAGDQGGATQLSEQISTLSDRMDELTSKIEELSTKMTVNKLSPGQQNIALQPETCDGSAPTSYFISGLSNGSLTGSILPNSSSTSQLGKESALMEEVQGIARGHRQIMHKLDNLCSLLRENSGERPRSRVRNEGKRKIVADVEPIKLHVALTLALGGLAIFLYKGFWTRN